MRNGKDDPQQLLPSRALPIISLPWLALLLCFPAQVQATVYEVDQKASVVHEYGGWIGGWVADLTVTGFLEAEIDGEQLSFVSTNVHFLPDDMQVFPTYPATLTGDRYLGRQPTCHGLGPDLWYEARIIGETIVIDGESHFPLCGNDGFNYYFHIVARQPQRIPQLHPVGIVLVTALIVLFGVLLMQRATS